MSGASSCSPAGARLLGARPFDEVSIEEIAAAAGVSKGLLYHYFPTKKDFSSPRSSAARKNWPS